MVLSRGGCEKKDKGVQPFGAKRCRATEKARPTSARATATSLFNVHRATHEFSRVQARDGRVGILGELHRDEGETTRVLSVGVAHDRTLLDLFRAQDEGSVFSFVLATKESVSSTTHATVFSKDFFEVAFLDAARETRDVEVVARVVLTAVLSPGSIRERELEECDDTSERRTVSHLPRSPPSRLSGSARMGERERERARAPRGEGERSWVPFPEGACQSESAGGGRGPDSVS